LKLGGSGAEWSVVVKKWSGGGTDGGVEGVRKWVRKEGDVIEG